MTATFLVGDIRVDRLVEQEPPSTNAILRLMPRLTEQMLAPYTDAMIRNGALHGEGGVIMPKQSYVVRVGGKTAMIDTCVGNHKDRHYMPEWHQKTDSIYLDALASAGLGVEDIDYVMCTHLHADHVGWNTRLENGRWVPTFPNARYIFSQAEFAFWNAYEGDDHMQHFDDSVLPIIAAGRCDLVHDTHEVVSGIELVPTPGHTPHHCSVSLKSKGEECFVTGDAIHSPIQCIYPEVCIMIDTDPDLSVRSRRAFLEKFADTAVKIATMHFPSPSVGHFISRGDAFDFRFLDGTAFFGPQVPDPTM